MPLRNLLKLLKLHLIIALKRIICLIKEDGKDDDCGEIKNANRFL